MDLFAPYQWLSDWLTYDVLKLAQHSHLAGGINFFVYDGLKIITMLLVINYVMAIIRHYLPLERIRDFLASRNWHGFDYFLAAVLGLITPFCSCSSIPLFVGFLGVGNGNYSARRRLWVEGNVVVHIRRNYHQYACGICSSKC